MRGVNGNCGMQKKPLCLTENSLLSLLTTTADYNASKNFHYLSDSDSKLIIVP